MLKIPYGLSHYKRLIEENFFFDDKTTYIELLESLGSSYIFLLRPRRFGKSLFVSMLRHYYGLEHKAGFEKMFGKTYIGKKPTPKANAYRVLSLEFSRIDTATPESTYRDFLRNVREGAKSFMDVYGFPADVCGKVLAEVSPAGVMAALFEACSDRGPAVYVTIDEYDHFANEILAFNFNAFSGMVSRNGFVRKFYESIKKAAGDGVVERMFVTGVTPITLDSLTSGFNIGTDLTMDPRFNAAMGFTEETVAGMLRDAGAAEPQKALADMRAWYNGYIFSVRADKKIYNPDMVLYFMKSMTDFGRYPDDMVDKNVATDYGKLGRLFHLQTPEDNFKALEEIVAGREVSAELTDRFSFERPFTRADFLSMLYFMGFLTHSGTGFGNIADLKVPNYVIWRLYVDFAAARLNERAELGMGVWDPASAMIALARRNDPKPFFAKMSETMKKLSARDAIRFDEKHLKMIFISLANLTSIYFIRSEAEVGKKYADVMLLNRPPVFPEWQFAFEFKYVKKEDADKAPAVLEEAKMQLRGYAQAEEWKSLGNLRSYAVVFVYDELYALAEV